MRALALAMLSIFLFPACRTKPVERFCGLYATTGPAADSLLHPPLLNVRDNAEGRIRFELKTDTMPGVAFFNHLTLSAGDSIRHCTGYVIRTQDSPWKLDMIVRFYGDSVHCSYTVHQRYFPGRSWSDSFLAYRQLRRVHNTLIRYFYGPLSGRPKG